MELAPRYCRSCGSRILVKHICHNCNRDPLNGENYCYDCGGLTPNADSCFKCGARYKRSSSVSPGIIIGSFLIIAMAVAGYFLVRQDKKSLAPEQATIVTETPALTDTVKQALPTTQDTIINKPTDTLAVIANKPADSIIIKTPAPDTAKKTEPDIFTSAQLNTYKIRCSYFAKKQKSQVMFFIAAGSGYIKVNEKVYELKRKRKGADVAVFGGAEYDATITIDGLSGSDREWLSSCTLIIKDLLKNTSLRYKVYSTCIEL